MPPEKTPTNHPLVFAEYAIAAGAINIIFDT
jgi:hypothetical protein